MKFIRFFVCLYACTAAARAELPFGLSPGEAFTYRVSWGIFPHAGEIEISAATEPPATAPSPERLLVKTRTSTRGVVRALFAFDGEGEAWFDTANGDFLEARATTRTRSERTQASIVFDHQASRAVYADAIKPARSASLVVPPGRPMDFIMSLFQARTWDLSPGASRDVLVLFDDQFYPMRITAERIEIINTPSGPQSALLLIPRMIGKPRGMFRRGGEVRVWIARDTPQLPVRFEVKLRVGTAVAVLTRYQAPLSTLALETTAPH
jgi:hypothetical protein